MTAARFWQCIVITICLFVIYSQQNTEHNICSQGEVIDDAIMLTLDTIDVNEKCCCSLQVMSDTSSGDPTVLVFVKFSCTITFTKTYNWLSGISCNGTGSWKTVQISKTMDICVNHNSVKTTPAGRLGFNNTGTGHDWKFSLSCNSSGHSTPPSSVATSTSPVSSVSSSTTTTTTTTTVSSSVSTNNVAGALGTSSSNDQDENRQFPIGVVVGAVVAGVAVTVIIISGFFLIQRCKKTTDNVANNIPVSDTHPTYSGLTGSGNRVYDHIDDSQHTVDYYNVATSSDYENPSDNC